MDTKNELQPPAPVDLRMAIKNPLISRRRVGIWQVLTMKEPLFSTTPFVGWMKPIPFTLLGRFMWDVYSLNPVLTTLYMLTMMWSGIRSGVALNMSGNLLMVVSTVLMYPKFTVSNFLSRT
jgi:hypothetical protein